MALKKPKNNSLREKTDKNSGGQPNHKGHTLEKVDTPDFTVDIKDDICPCCSSNLQEISLLILLQDRCLIYHFLKFKSQNTRLTIKFALIVIQKIIPYFLVV